jgi:hypothetical protein
MKTKIPSNAFCNFLFFSYFSFSCPSRLFRYRYSFLNLISLLVCQKISTHITNYLMVCLTLICLQNFFFFFSSGKKKNRTTKRKMSNRGQNKPKSDSGLTASTIEALKEFGDVNKFIKQTEDTEIKRKVAELVAYFPGFSISELESVLKKNNGNVDNGLQFNSFLSY